MSASIHVFYYTGEYTAVQLPDAAGVEARLSPERRRRLGNRMGGPRAVEIAALRLLEIAMQARGYASFALADVDYPEVGGVTGKPIWRGGTADFNISHANGMAMVAVSPHAIGVDVELRRAIDPRIVRRVLSDESALARDLNEANSLARWTQIESVIKAAGLGIMHGAEIEWAPPTARLRGRRYEVSPVDCDATHVAHVACDAPGAKLETIKVELL